MFQFIQHQTNQNLFHIYIRHIFEFSFHKSSIPLEYYSQTFGTSNVCLRLGVEWNKNFYGDLRKLWWKFDKVSLKHFNAISLDYLKYLLKEVEEENMLQEKYISFAKCFLSHKSQIGLHFSINVMGVFVAVTSGRYILLKWVQSQTLCLLTIYYGHPEYWFCGPYVNCGN